MTCFLYLIPDMHPRILALLLAATQVLGAPISILPGNNLAARQDFEAFGSSVDKRGPQDFEAFGGSVDKRSPQDFEEFGSSVD